MITAKAVCSGPACNGQADLLDRPRAGALGHKLKTRWIMDIVKWRNLRRWLMAKIQEYSHDIEELSQSRRDLIHELEELEKKKPQRGTEA
jgi:uncharacterized coiled-coil DUF342 family protein